MKDVFYPKFFSLAQSGIPREQFSSDILSGVVVGIVALPLSIAFAVASGVSPEKGLITGVIAGFIISFLGGSRVQIGGPTGAFVVIIAGIVEKYGIEGLFYSNIFAGGFLILFGLFKIGRLLKYIPHPLTVGFTSGIALVIFTTQIKDALGLPLPTVPSEFLEKLPLYWNHLHETNPWALAIALATIFISLVTGRITKRIPGSIIAIILMSVAVQLLRLPVETIGSLYGDIPNRFHLAVPAPDMSLMSGYLQSGLVIALLGGIESLLSASVADGMISGSHRSNTELVAQGIANVVCPFFGGIPATGAIARTAANVKNGGRTPIAGMVHSLTLLSVMLFFGPWARFIPMSCLAGILIVVSYNMSEWRSFRAMLKGHGSDVIVLLVTFVLTVVVDLVAAIEVGVVLSSLLFMKRMGDLADKRIDFVVDTDVIDDYSDLPEGLGIYEISGPLFFASVRRFVELLKEIGLRNRVLIIRMRHVAFVDHTGRVNLFDALEFLKEKGIVVLISGLDRGVETDLLASGLDSLVSRENLFSSYREAAGRGAAIVKSSSTHS